MADAKITALTALTTPALEDLIPIVDDPSGTPVTKKISVLNLISTGWSEITDTWAYASATTITVPSGAASLYQKGDKLRLTQTTVKYFYIVGVADTVLTVTGGSDYTVANAAITDIAISRASDPFGFPGYFSFTPVFTNLTVGSATNIGRFTLSGLRVHGFTKIAFAADTSISGGVSIGMPLTVDSNYDGLSVIGTVQMVNASPIGAYFGTLYGATTSGIRVTNVASTYAGPTSLSSTVPFTWTTNDIISTSFDYKMA